MDYDKFVGVYTLEQCFDSFGVGVTACVQVDDLDAQGLSYLYFFLISARNGGLIFIISAEPPTDSIIFTSRARTVPLAE